VDYLSLRHAVSRPVDLREIERWREDGIRILAFRRGDGAPVQAPSELDSPLRAGDSAVVAGPADAIRRVILAADPGPLEGSVR
jgi:hypothetical protein